MVKNQGEKEFHTIRLYISRDTLYEFENTLTVK